MKRGVASTLVRYIYGRQIVVGRERGKNGCARHQNGGLSCNELLYSFSLFLCSNQSSVWREGYKWRWSSLLYTVMMQKQPLQKNPTAQKRRLEKLATYSFAVFNAR